MDKRAGGKGWLFGHAPQSGMGMNPAPAMSGDREVKLRRPRSEHHHIARLERPRCGSKTQGFRGRHPAFQTAQPQRIATGQTGRPAYSGQRGVQQADAVKPGLGVAAMEAKGAAYQVLRRRSQLARGDHCTGLG